MGCRKSHTPCTLVDFFLFFDRHVACPRIFDAWIVANRRLRGMLVVCNVALNSLTRMIPEMIQAAAALFLRPRKLFSVEHMVGPPHTEK